MYKIIFLSLFFSITIVAIDDFNMYQCKLYGAVIYTTLLPINIFEKVNLQYLVTGFRTKKRIAYIAKAYQEFSNT